jgi:hypothetical protein
MKLLFVTLLIIALTAVTAAPTWKVCQGAPTHLVFNNVNINYAKPNISITWDGKVDAPLTGGSLFINVFFSGASV